MRVLHIIESLNPGGAERVCVDLSNLLRERGVQVSILTVTELGALARTLYPDIEVHCLKRGRKLGLGAILKLKKIVDEYEIVHVHMRFTYQYVRLITLLFFMHKKVILHDHYGRIGIDQRTPLFLSGVFRPHYYVGVSTELTTWAKTKLKVDACNVFLLENIVVRTERPVDRACDTAVLVSNFNRIKNHLFAIKLIEQSRFNLVIYGKVLDKEYFQEIKNYVLENGLVGKIAFIHNEINAQRQLGKYGFGLHSAVSESGPLVLIEYLAQAVPFVAYNTGQVARTIKGDLPDFFMNNFNLKEWQARIEKVLQVEPSNLLAAYNKYFDPAKYVEKCLRIYEEILAR